jgi:hypothetical protein
MRYMMLVRSVAPEGPPPSAFLEAMGKLSAEGRESGMLIAGGQLGGADASARVRLAAGKIGVTDGPFPEAKEVIGGYAILEYADKKAALEGCAGFLELHRQHWPGWEGEIEMRAIVHEDQRPSRAQK